MCNAKRNAEVGHRCINLWCCGVVVIITAQFHSTKTELRLHAGSNPAHGMSQIRDGEDLWQWSRLEIRLNAFYQSTIPQKQLIIIIIISTVTDLISITKSEVKPRTEKFRFLQFEKFGGIKSKTQENRSYCTKKGINYMHSLLLTDGNLITSQWSCKDCINSRPTVCCEYKVTTS